MKQPILLFRSTKDDQEVIFNALNFTRHSISTYYSIITAPLEKSLSKPLLDEMNKLIEDLRTAEQFFRNNGSAPFVIFTHDSTYSFVMNIIMSSLEVYRHSTEETKKKYNSSAYDSILNTISKLQLQAKEGIKNDLFLRFDESKVDSNQLKTVKFFISYQQDDVDVACKIQDLIEKNSSLKKQDIFVAHRDMQLSEEWRKQMMAELDNSTHLLAVCTNSYIKSAFGNQEVGYAIAKQKKITPIFWEGTKRSDFGFLESLQALPEFANNANLESFVQIILRKFGVN